MLHCSCSKRRSEHVLSVPSRRDGSGGLICFVFCDVCETSYMFVPWFVFAGRLAATVVFYIMFRFVPEMHGCVVGFVPPRNYIFLSNQIVVFSALFVCLHA